MIDIRPTYSCLNGGYIYMHRTFKHWLFLHSFMLRFEALQKVFTASGHSTLQLKGPIKL